MKRTFLIFTLFVVMLSPSLVMAQEDSFMIYIFEENAPKRFNAPKTPTFSFKSKNQNYMMDKY